MKTLDSIGDEIRYTVGRVTITLQWVREDAYSVAAYQGGTLRRDEWCKGHELEADARIWARMVAAAARTEQGIPQPCGCRGVGWISTGEMWWPCFSCNSGGGAVAASSEMVTA